MLHCQEAEGLAAGRLAVWLAGWPAVRQVGRLFYHVTILFYQVGVHWLGICSPWRRTSLAGVSAEDCV